MEIRSVDRSQVALLGMTRDELRKLSTALGEKPYRGDQIADWLYAKKAGSIDEMANLPREFRKKMSEQYEAGLKAPVSVAESADGTNKYLYGGPSGGAGGALRGSAAERPRYVEAAFIPEARRATLCLSTQIGCGRGCLFCMTGRQGLHGNLTAGEILNQFAALPERDMVTNVVLMGMGEPLDNVDAVLRSLSILTSDRGFGFGCRRVTVSTVGVLPGLERLLRGSSCRIAISLHSPFDEQRASLMPVQRVCPIAEVVELIRHAGLGKYRRVSFEYIVFRGLNHSRAHVNEIARLLGGIRCRINLIRFHRLPDVPFEAADPADMEEFRSALEAKGIPTTIRLSRGEDVQAACGLLSTKELW